MRVLRLEVVGGLRDDDVVDQDTGDADVVRVQRPDLRRAVLKDGAFAYVNPELYP